MDRRALLLGPLPAALLAGCGVSSVAQVQPDNAPTAGSTDDQTLETPAPNETELVGAAIPPDDPITVPLTLYLMADAADAAGSPLSSRRSEDGLSVIAQDMGELWAQANVVFDPVNIESIEVPTAVLEGIALGLDTSAFFDQAGVTFDLPNAAAVNGFYVRAAGRANGFAPSGSRVFFVIDEPSVHDERVSSHEVGHIFGLHHQLDDPGTLMFSGTNGTLLTSDEITVARYAAQGVLDGAR